MGKKLYIGNLSYDVTDADLQQLLGQHGTVESAVVIMDKMSGRSKGFGFVEMSSDAEAQAAIAALNGKDHGGRATDRQRSQASRGTSPRRRRRRWWPRRLRRRTPLTFAAM